MKYFVLVCFVVFSLVIALSEECGGSGRAGGGREPRKQDVRPKLRSYRKGKGPFGNIRVYGYIERTKPSRPQACRYPNACREQCEENEYILGKYGCSGAAMCCAQR